MEEKNKKSTPEKRSIRNIPLSKKQAIELEKIEEGMKDSPMSGSPLSDVPPPKSAITKRAAAMGKVMPETPVKKHRSHRKLMWVLGTAILLLVIYGIAHSFAQANISIVRAKEIVVLSNETFAIESAGATTSSMLNVKYETRTIDTTASTTIKASGQQTIQKKATGKVVIYNDSSSAQLLVSTTRLQTTDGLIFRLDNTVTVPAKKNVTVTVTADQAGSKYNVSSKTFSFPGLSGTSKAKTVYAKSSGSMSGGSVSTVPQTSAEELATAKATLLDSLRTQSLEAAAESIPNGYDILEGSVIITYSTIKQTFDGTTKTATLSQTAQATVYYFERNSFSSAVAAKGTIFALSSSTPNAIIDTQSLQVASLSTSEKTATLTGTSTVMSNLDKDQIARNVSGLTRDSALRAIQAMPGIDMVEISIKPFWERKLPKTASLEVVIE